MDERSEIQPLLISDESSSIEIQKPQKPQFSEVHRWIAVLSSALGALNFGTLITGSYLIDLATFSCSKWSPSTGVYAESVTLGVLGFGSPILSFIMNAYGPHFLMISGFLLTGLGWSLASLGAGFCGNAPMVTEVAYIVSYGFLLGIGQQCFFLSNLSLLVSWFPTRVGFCSTFPMISFAIGGAAYGQWFLEMRRLQEKEILQFGTILFMTGLIATSLYIVSVFAKRPPPPPAPEGKKWTLKDIVKDYRFWFVLYAEFILLLPVWGLVGRQKQLLEAIWQKDNSPIRLLTGLASGAYLVGRIIWMIIADYVKQVDLWMVTGSLEALSLCFLPIFMYNFTGQWAVYASLAVYCIDLIVFTVPKALAPALFSELYGPDKAAFMGGFQAPSFGLSGFLGPVIADKLYLLTGKYTAFLLMGAGICISGLIVLALIKPSRCSTGTVHGE